MTFIDDSGNQLEVDVDFAITKQVVSLFDFAIKGDFSVTFSVDNNSVNRKVLGYSGPQMLNQVAFTKQRFSRVINGNVLDRGFIVIQADEGDQLKCFYVSGNVNWINELIERTTQLDMLDYVSQWDETGIMIDTIANDSGIVYPLVDWAYNFQKATSTFRTLPIVDASDNTFVDFYPCFYLKDLVTEIIYQSGFKLAGNILDDGIYQKIIITPDTADIKRNAQFINDRTVFASKLTSQNLAVVGTDYKITFDNVTRTSRLFANSKYTADCAYHVTLKVSVKTSVSQAYTVTLFIDGVTSLETRVFTGLEGNIIFTDLETAAGRYYEIYIKVNTGTAADVSVNTTVEISPDEDVIPRSTTTEHVYPNDFINMKCIDVIKFVTMYFGCYVHYDDYSKTLTINKIDSLIESEDWSEYLQSFKAIYDKKQATNNFIRLQPATDETLVNYNSRYLTGFGEGNLITNIDFNRNNELYTAPFQACESRITLNYGQFMMPFIGLVNLEDDNEYLEYTTVTDSTGLAQFNGTDFNLAGGEVLRFVDDNSIYSGYGVVSSTSTTTVFIQGHRFRGNSSGIFYKQKATYVKGKNRILLNHPNFDLDNLGVGDVQGASVSRHTLTVDTTIASGDPEVFQVLFTNTSYSKTIQTTGTETKNGVLLYVDNVTAQVTRTNNAVDQVTVDWSRNGGASEHTEIITAGNPVNVSYTYLTTLSTDDFTVTIVEG